jgi:hypothetical protein
MRMAIMGLYPPSLILNLRSVDRSAERLPSHGPRLYKSDRGFRMLMLQDLKW